MSGPLPLHDDLASLTDRYHRQTLIPWWDQARVRRARILVLGAGALGNEILELLALTGVGQVLVCDLDTVERSNLSRTVLFRDEDEGALKAEVAARRAGELNPDVTVVGRALNIVHELGLGAFVWADVVICGLDNRLARLFASRACAATGRPLVDGAIEGFSGVVRVFDPAAGPCYECTMSAVDRRIVAERRSCAMLARDAVRRGHVPTTAVLASLVASLEVQEALKRLHGQPTLDGEALHVEGLTSEFRRIRYPRRPDCPGHDRLGEVEPLGVGVADISLGELLARAESRLGEGVTLDLSRDVVTALECPACEARTPAGVALGALAEADAACPACGAHRIVDFTASVSPGDGLDLDRTPADIGVPPFDVVVARRGLEARIAWLFDADAGAALGPLAGRFDPAPPGPAMRDGADR